MLSLQQVPAIVLDNLYRKGVNFIDASQVDPALLFVFVEDVDAAPVTVRMRNNLVSEQVDLDALSARQDPKLLWSDLHGHHHAKSLTY